MSDRKNAEGYSDPTAYQAMMNLEIEELRFKRKRRFDKVRIDDDKELKALEELERKEGKAHISDD